MVWRSLVLTLSMASLTFLGSAQLGSQDATAAGARAVNVQAVSWTVEAGSGETRFASLRSGHPQVPGSPAWTQKACNKSAISRDMGEQLVVRRCHGDWAYVSIDDTGQAPSLLRLVDGTWTRYTGFPSTICKGAAATDGVPPAELSSFRPC